MYRVASPDDLVGAEGERPWTNRLVHETSPYLLQHAHNPVDWHPWAAETFERARLEDRPILLSIGYAACHWCHVMEHESFSDPEVAAFLNAHFVPVKVDREERPDVDAIYIEALYALHGSAGWPANLFLSPDLYPFAGATYLPPESRYGMPSFLEVLHRVRTAWVQQRAEIDARRDALQGILGRTLPPSGDRLARPSYERAVRELVASHDPQHGGQGRGQKFPQTPSLELLLLAAFDGLPGARTALARALRAMARGGLYDHLGGGFHRYCVDPAWTVPHFEKMLYDNAQLLRLYARASSALAEHDPTLAEECARVARETVHYLEHDLSDDSGAFWSSEDADDPGGEGFFYTFTAEEARAILGPAEPLPYGITLAGNFEHGRTVLSAWEGRPPEDVRQRLLLHRNRRRRPSVDHKRVVAWNGLAVGGLAEAGRLLGYRSWIERATTCAEVLLGARRPDGSLPRLVGSDAPGTLEDHACVADGLLDLYQARPHEIRWLDEALAITRVVLRDFSDPEAGAFFQSRPRDDLILRRKDFQDGAEPSGNGRMAAVVLRLLGYGAPIDSDLADRLLEAGSGFMARASLATPELWGVLRALSAPIAAPGGPHELVIAGAPDRPETSQMLDVWDRTWRPQGIAAVIPPGGEGADRYGLLANRPSGEGGAPLAYLCRRGVCSVPTASPADLASALGDGLP